jgi:hypothetical protein
MAFHAHITDYERQGHVPAPGERRTMTANPKSTQTQSRLEKAARENNNLGVDYEGQAKIIREKTARLKALRLAKEASEKKNSDA